MGTIKKRYQKSTKAPIYKTKKFWVVLLSLLTAVILFFIFLYLPFYQLEEIEISGNRLTSIKALKTITKREMETCIGQLGSKSLIFFSGAQIEKKIVAKLPHIESVDVKRIFPDKLLVNVKQRKADFIWCVNNKCFEIDLSGIAFRGTNKDPKKTVVIDQTKNDLSLGQKVFWKQQIDHLFKAKEELEKRFDFKSKKIIIPEEKSFFIEIEGAPQLRFDFKSDVDKQIKRLELLLENEIENIEDLEYIELRYGNQIYYK